MSGRRHIITELCRQKNQKINKNKNKKIIYRPTVVNLQQKGKFLKLKTNKRIPDGMA